MSNAEKLPRDETIRAIRKRGTSSFKCQRSRSAIIFFSVADTQIGRYKQILGDNP